MVAGGRRRGRKKKEREDGPVHSGTRAYEEVCDAPSRPTRSEYRTTRKKGEILTPARCGSDVRPARIVPSNGPAQVRIYLFFSFSFLFFSLFFFRI
jgi:hypothetical protein